MEPVTTLNYPTADQTQTIVPFVYRDDNAGGLRRLTRSEDPTVYIRMLQRAPAVTDTISGNDRKAMEDVETRLLRNYATRSTVKYRERPCRGDLPETAQRTLTL